jgi:hypothetical protein
MLPASRSRIIPRVKRNARSVAVVAVLLVVASCKLVGKKQVTCREFTSREAGPTWSSCDDKVKREVQCSDPFAVRHQMVLPRPKTDLDCSCYEDGVKKMGFIAKEPPPAAREDATRIANANCHWAISP